MGLVQELTNSAKSIGGVFMPGSRLLDTIKLNQSSPEPGPRRKVLVAGTNDVAVGAHRNICLHLEGFIAARQADAESVVATLPHCYGLDLGDDETSTLVPEGLDVMKLFKWRAAQKHVMVFPDSVSRRQGGGHQVYRCHCLRSQGGAVLQCHHLMLAHCTPDSTVTTTAISHRMLQSAVTAGVWSKLLNLKLRCAISFFIRKISAAESSRFGVVSSSGNVLEQTTCADVAGVVTVRAVVVSQRREEYRLQESDLVVLELESEISWLRDVARYGSR
ncbi:hypothetical protein J6590_030122 [Homalodisca vitripennis]|nr:hypothetical protein J6590_030122 [Homalodisca vitripennis]